MVLRIKEREEAIQIVAMDLQVCGKLCMLHQRDNGVDVEALHDRIHLQQDTGKAPRWDLMGREGCGGGKQVSLLSPKVTGYKRIYRRKKQVGGAARGPRGWGRAQGGRRASLPRGRLVSFLTSTPSTLDCVCSKNHSPEGFIPFGFRLIFLFCETLKQAKKQQFGLGLRLVGQSQK